MGGYVGYLYPLPRTEEPNFRRERAAITLSADVKLLLLQRMILSAAVLCGYKTFVRLFRAVRMNALWR